MTEHIDYTDVKIPVARILDWDMATVGSNEETLQLIRFSLPDGTYSPWLALSPARYIEMHADMRQRIQAGLEAQYTV